MPLPSLHQFPRRQLILWFVAVLLPCVLLVALSVKMLTQERELAVKRAADSRRLEARQLGHDLLEALEAVKNAERSNRSESYAHAATAFVARIAGGHIVLPWHDDPQAKRFAAAVVSGEFGARLREGQVAEHRLQDYRAAARLYLNARSLARDSLQMSAASLAFARVVARERPSAADSAVLPVALLPYSIRDESGVPLALYALPLLSRDAAQHPSVRQSLRTLTAAMARSRYTSPTGCYAAQLAEQPDSPLPRGHCEELERAEQLAHDATWTAANSRARSGVVGAGWHVNGSPIWLVSADRSSADRGQIVAVRLDSVAANRLPSGSAILSSSAIGEPLGPALPGLWLERSARLEPASTVGAFYVTALLLALSVILIGSYLLWRDVRRELRMAELRSQFVAGVTHELKTPLTSIRMFAETLRTHDHTPAAQRQEYLDTIIGESARLTRLLNNVLDFSRMERGERRFRMDTVDVRECAQTTVRAMRYPLEQQGFTLTVSDEAGVPLLIRADGDAVEQALLNLLANAMKYSGQSRRLWLGLARREGHVVVSVRDEGVGLATGEHERIFEKFYRVRSPINESVAGAGLGLALVQQILAAHGGRVTVESTPNRGSTFTLLFPAAGAENESVADIGAHTASSGARA